MLRWSKRYSLRQMPETRRLIAWMLLSQLSFLPYWISQMVLASDSPLVLVELALGGAWLVIEALTLTAGVATMIRCYRSGARQDSYALFAVCSLILLAWSVGLLVAQ